MNAPRLRPLCVIVAVLFLAGPPPSHAQVEPSRSEHATGVEGQTLLPGDVITFLGGELAFGGRQGKYGHSSMYIGRDPRDAKPLFFDFRDKGSRILTQEDFFERYRELDVERSFDVYRPLAPIDVKKLMNAADYIDKHYKFAVPGAEGPAKTDGRLVCSQAIYKCLEIATNKHVSALAAHEKKWVSGVFSVLVTPDDLLVTPDGFSDPKVLGNFFRKVNVRPLPLPDTGWSFIDDYVNSALGITRDLALAQQIRRGEEVAFHQKVRKNAMQTWAQNACLYLNGVSATSTGELRELQQDLQQRLKTYLLTNQVVLTSAEIVETLAGDSGAMSKCQRSMMQFVLEAPTPLDAASVVARIDYVRAGGRSGEVFRTLLQNAKRDIAEGTLVLIRGITGPFVAVAEALSSPSNPSSPSQREGGDRNNSGDPGHNAPSLGSIYHQDLRGIASERRGFD